MYESFHRQTKPISAKYLHNRIIVVGVMIFPEKCVVSRKFLFVIFLVVNRDSFRRSLSNLPEISDIIYNTLMHRAGYARLGK